MNWIDQEIAELLWKQAMNDECKPKDCLRVRPGTAADGGCNFCNRNRDTASIWVLKGNNTTLEVRMCAACVNEFQNAIW